MIQAKPIPDHDAVVAMFEEQARKEDAYFKLIADKIEANPSLLRKPLETVVRWIAEGHWAVEMLTQWRQKLEAARQSRSGLDSLLQILRDDSEDARYFKGFSPLIGLLTEKEAEILL